MTKKNPDDSVRKEQFGANEIAAGTEDAIHAKNAKVPDSLVDAEKADKKPEKVIEPEEYKTDEASATKTEKENPDQKMFQRLMILSFLLLIIQDILSMNWLIH